MIWFWILTGILALSAADEYIGPGRWLIISVEKCPEDEIYPINFEIAKKKVNRTHDGFHGSMVLNQALDDEFGINIDICKYVDGGCKQIQVLQDDCLCCFARKYAKDNLERGLTLAGIDPPDCPIKQGSYEIKDFVIDYDELPNNSIYGRFMARVELVGKALNKPDTEVLGCIILNSEFNKCEDDEDE
ncbi:uncharacterized protein LOC114241020 [Bombyx mandarina]|uniref:Uncharacterized protein LOC114241020 n=1 Tax=Bombyx mandarina TaxID=7092 RepID=A0A6J2JDK6_BOMMA|nr:uncharacterized protein LOC114241020 [Bombyx mandarina]